MEWKIARFSKSEYIRTAFKNYPVRSKVHCILYNNRIMFLLKWHNEKKWITVKIEGNLILVSQILLFMMLCASLTYLHLLII